MSVQSLKNTYYAKSGESLAFWGKLLKVASIGVSLFGLDMILFQDTLNKFLWNKLFFFNSDLHLTFSSATQHFVNLNYGVMGAFMVGWGLSLLQNTRTAFRTCDQRDWKALATSVGAWFISDCLFSIKMGYWQNAVFNLPFGLLFAVPLIMTKKYFKRADN
jgi:hypothetical protein